MEVHGGNLRKPGPLSQRGGESQVSELGLLGEPPHPIQMEAGGSEGPQSLVLPLPIAISPAEAGGWQRLDHGPHFNFPLFSLGLMAGGKRVSRSHGAQWLGTWALWSESPGSESKFHLLPAVS